MWPIVFDLFVAHADLVLVLVSWSGIDIDSWLVCCSQFSTVGARKWGTGGAWHRVGLRDDDMGGNGVTEYVRFRKTFWWPYKTLDVMMETPGCEKCKGWVCA